KSQDVDKILGLNTGADDYLAKPFNPLELLARIKSQLRRRCKDSMAATGEEIRIDDLTINIGSHKVMRGLIEIKLTPKEFTILELLARNRGLVFSIQHIYERAWKEEFVQSDNTVMVHIRKIREKIEENPRMPRYIKTVWGVGYKFE
ncbi:MAG: winged helix-turn-helix domain-containing protein, partial [Acidaminococcaceae bacterium]